MLLRLRSGSCSATPGRPRCPRAARSLTLRRWRPAEPEPLQVVLFCCRFSPAHGSVGRRWSKARAWDV